MRLFIASIALLVPLITAAPAHAAEGVILYGGLSYIDQDTTPLMSRFLDSKAAGADLQEGKALMLETERLVEDIVKADWLPEISTTPVLMSSGAAWEIAIKRGAPARAPGRLSAELTSRFDAVYGLVLVGNFEEMIEQTLPVTDEKTGARVVTYMQTYLVGVDALLVRFDGETNSIPIRLASSSFVTLTDTVVDKGDRASPTRRTANFRKAYEQAIAEALTRLGHVGRTSGRAKNDTAEASTYMVTGFAIQHENAASIFDYDLSKKPNAQQLQRDVCTVPSGCPDGASECRKFGELVTHAMTSAFSEAGYAVLPPYKSEYVADAGRNISRNLRIQSDEESLFNGTHLIEIRPSDAGTKVVAVLRNANRADELHKVFNFMRVRTYVSKTGYVSASTGFDGCTPVGSISGDKLGADTYGCATEQYILSQGEPTEQTDRDLYVLSAVNQLKGMSEDLKHGQSAKNRRCEGVDSLR